MPEATALLNQIVGGLEGLANEPIRLIGEDRTFLEIWGWNAPAMNRHEFAAMIRSPIKDIQSVLLKNFEDADFQTLSRIPEQITYLQANTLPQLSGGNAFHVYVTISSFLRKLAAVIDKYRFPDIEWQEIEDKKLVPVNIQNELRQLRSQISGMTSQKKDLEGAIDRIIAAAAASKTLSADLDALQNAKENFLGTQRSATENQLAMETAKASAERVLNEIRKLEGDAEKLVANTQGAFAAATSTGLGKEFETRAKTLASEVKWLSTFLTLIIVIGAVVTYFRIEFIHQLMKRPPINMELIWANVVMTFASLAGPVWLAWLLTKQIGQRFRLSEDYGFKASVAKAYAGYRQEAARINDPEFEKRLYATALNRIDEPPLRYVENESDGSPWHNLFRRKDRSSTEVLNPSATSLPLAP